MKNGYGMTLDRNGYAPSVIQDRLDRCYLTARRGVKLDRHEIFHGAARVKSKRLGLWVMLDHEVHMILHHRSAETDRQLKRIGQQLAMEHYGWTIEDFIREFGKNYL